MSKTEGDDLKKISVSFLKKHDYFCGWRSGVITWTRSGVWGENKNSVGIETSISDNESYLRIHYTQTDRDTNEKNDFDYKIPITSTPCHFGGKRYWFTCPWYKNGRYCGRRVGTLYKDGNYFACRHCYEITYASRNVSKTFRIYSSFFNLMDEDENKIPNRTYYNGKPTKRYLHYLKKGQKLEYISSMMPKLLGKKGGL